MKLIIINGASGSGKSTLLRAIRPHTDLPIITKDGIKEFLYDNLGSKDLEWSKMLGTKVSTFIWQLADGVLSYGSSVIIESAFHYDFAVKDVQRLLAKYPGLEVIEIFCSVDETTRRKRYKERHESGERHPGHYDAHREDHSEHERFKPINIGQVVRVDTTNDQTIQYEELKKFFRSSE